MSSGGKSKSGARALFDVRPGEGRVTLLAFLGLLGVTAAHTLIETARDALFLARIKPTHLPALYLTIAAAGLLTSRASVILAARKKAREKAKAAASSGNSTATTATTATDSSSDASKKKSRLDSVTITFLGAAIITAGFWTAASSPTPMLLYALYIFSGMFAGYVAGQLWLRFGSLFTVTQAKRLYGAIGTGAVLGAVLGSALARGALAIIEVRHLLLGASGLLVVTALGPVGLLPTPPAKPRSRAAIEREEEAPPTSFRSEVVTVTSHPYLVRLLLLTLFAACAGTAIDFLFKREIAGSMTAAELGPFIATVSLATNAASLLAQAIGVGVAVRWLGIHRALYVMPLLIGIGAGAAVLGGGLFAVLAMRGADGSLRYSLHKTTSELLFVPLPDSLRSRAKPIIDLLAQRGGQAVASVAILALATLLPSKTVGVAVGATVLALAIAWLVLARTILPRYLEVFRSTLRQGRVELKAELPNLDIGALEALFAALSSRKDPEVIGALDILAAQPRRKLIPPLVLYHPSPIIVLHALDLLVREKRTDFVGIADWLLDHPNAEVRAAALRARAAVDPNPEFLRAKLNAPHEEVSATALVALVCTGELASDETKAAFETVLKSQVDARRALARAFSTMNVLVDAAIEGGTGVSDENRNTSTTHSVAHRELIEEVVLRLVHDDDTETRKLAATAMGALGFPSFVPVLIEMLADRVAGLAAVEALGVMGETSVKLLDETLDEKSVAPEVKWRIVGALARSTTTEKAVGILVRRVTTTDDTALRSRILRALRALSSTGVAIPIKAADLVTLANGTITAIARALSLRLMHAELLSAREKLASLAGAELIQRLLRDKEIEGLDRLFLVLALLYPEERFPRIQRGLESPDVKRRASGRELLENVISSPLRESVIAVIDEIDDKERLQRIGQPRTETSYEELIQAMIEQGGELGALAVFHAGEAGFRASMREAIAKMDASGAALARELGEQTLDKGSGKSLTSSSSSIGSSTDKQLEPAS